MKVLVSAPYLQPHLDRFRPLFEKHDIELVVPPVTERLEEEELLRYIGDIDGVICGDDRFTERVLEAAPRLKVIAKWGTGIDSINKAACKRIVVCNTPNAFSEPVADSVLGYMLCFARKLPWTSQAMRRGEWEKIPGRALRECTLGIIGVGNVGQAVARRGVAFGMRMLGTDPVLPPDDVLHNTGVHMVALEQLLRESDFVTVNCDLNPTSRHLLHEATFSIMKSEAVVINTARGPIIKEPDLVQALEAGQIAGAALDVFEDEPLPKDSPLRRMDNVMLAPHNANSSPQAWERVHQNTIRQLLDVLLERTSISS